MHDCHQNAIGYGDSFFFGSSQKEPIWAIPLDLCEVCPASDFSEAALQSSLHLLP